MLKKIAVKIIFIFLIAVIAAYFIRNIIITRVVEREATKANKAIVEVDKLNYGVFGNKLTTGRIQVSDVRDTNKNLLEAEGLSVEVDLGEILDESVIVKDIFLKGVRFGTAREKDGRVEGLTPVISKESSSYEELMGNLKKNDIEKLSPKEIIQNELDRVINGFESQLSAKYQKDSKKIAERKNYWDSKLKNNENKKKVEELKVKAEKLAKEIKATKNPFEIVGKEKELKAIYAEADKIYKSIEGDKKEFEKDLKEFTALPEKYKETALMDKNRISNLISLDSKGLEDLINRILGQELGESIYKVVNDFNGLNEKMKSSGGEKGKPQVDVFVERARMTMNVAGVSIEGQATNIPSDPKKSRGPIDFKINGSKGNSKVDIDGFVNLLSSEQQLNLKLVNLKLSEFVKELSFGDAIFNLNQKLYIKGKKPVLTGELEILDFKSKESIGVSGQEIMDIIFSEAINNLKDVKASYQYDNINKRLKIDSNLSKKLTASLKNSFESNSGLIANTLQEKYAEKGEEYFEQIKKDSTGFGEEIGAKLEKNSKEIKNIMDEIKKNTGLDAGNILKKVF
ncbi:hypothetical protein [uncultured Ilyobacter sp.]|uniref:hypothetical protein n=1 Tax=uncultured Ilyobacter sp. TaxID=544433 RepID=UPI0029C6F97A|nr:hypothetical protein [uncultured Ilyobacter sp.]